VPKQCFGFVALELVLECVAPSVSLTVDRNVPQVRSVASVRDACSESGRSSFHHFRTTRQLFLMALNIWKVTPERAAVRLVRTILKESSSPLTTKEIYKEAVRREAKLEYPHPPTVVTGTSALQPARLVVKRGLMRSPPPSPPHPENAIRSIRCVGTHLRGCRTVPGLKLMYSPTLV